MEVCLFTIGVMWFGTSGMMSCRDALGGVIRIGVFVFFLVFVFCLLLSLEFPSYLLFFLAFVIEGSARMPGESSRIGGHRSRG